MKNKIHIRICLVLALMGFLLHSPLSMAASASPQDEEAEYTGEETADTIQREHVTARSSSSAIKNATTPHKSTLDGKTGSSMGTWVVMIGAILSMGCLTLIFRKGINAKMNNLKIGVKTIGMVGILILLMAASSGFGIFKIGVIGEELKGIAEEDIPLTEAVSEITVNQLEQAVWFERALRYGEVMADKQTAAKGLKHAEESFEARSRQVIAIEEKAQEIAKHALKNAHTETARQEFENVVAQLDIIGKHHGNYEHHVLQAFALIHQGKLHEAEQLAEKIEAEEEKLDHELEQLLKEIEAFTEAAAHRAESDEQSAFTGMVAMTLGALIIGLTMGFFISRGITQPINAAVAGLKDIAQGEGDLTMRLEVSGKDETGEMARWFNVFIEKLQGIMKDIAGGVETLSSSSTELSAISEQMTQGITNVSEKSTTVAAASEEMNANMNNVAAAMEQSATNTNMVATASEEMSSTIGEIAQNAEKARGISDEAATKAASASTNMDQLGAAADSIGKVIEAITDISEQVNLLALNATIEAARAGEAGKGFAVVANEIKELAQQTATATQNIKTEIEGIQGTTSKTVEQITEITQVITDVNSVVANIATAVEQQSAATKEIAANVAQASTGIQEVTENVNQSSAVSGEISSDIAGVSASMDEMSTSSSQVNISAQELSTLSESLKQMVDQFKI
jgi:methyl-accepting chemotaxis protein